MTTELHPSGQTCNDCDHFTRCYGLFRCPASNRTCDWNPSRFRVTAPVSSRCGGTGILPDVGTDTTPEIELPRLLAPPV